MKHSEFLMLRNHGRSKPYMRASDFNNNTKRTLVYGYTIDRDTFHAYIDPFAAGGPAIVRIIYSSSQRGGNLLSYLADREVAAELLVPCKRAYPERCNYSFALAMKECGHELCFTSYDTLRYHEDIPLKGFTLDHWEINI